MGFGVARLVQRAAASGLWVAASLAHAQPAAVASIDPLVECKVTGDGVNRKLSVDVAWPSGLRPRFPRDESGVIGEASVARIGALRTSPGRIEDNPDWAKECERDGCRLTYTVDVAKGVATDRRGNLGFEEKRKIVLAPLARWLVRPEDRRARGRLRLDFEGSKGFHLVSGVMDGRANHVETDLVMIDGPHVALGDFTHKSILVAGQKIDIAIGPGERRVRDDEIVTWVREAARDVASLLGAFPISRLQVIVASGGPYAIGSAVTMGMGGASIFVVVGERTQKADLLRDWVMTHEMLHVAFPNMGERQRWMEEGLSTYLEPLLRARRGRHDPQTLWAEFVRGMPQGLPKDGDQGLDRTLTWGRRYWGGALFWLHLDVEIRRRSEGTKSLDDVLRAIHAAGGNVSVRWDVSRLAMVAEGATGTTALKEIYDEWSTKAVVPDLPGLWSSLGVKPGKGERVSFDDRAPLADLRRHLTARFPTAPAVAALRPGS